MSVPDGTPGAGEASDVIAAAINEAPPDTTGDVAASSDAPIEAEVFEGEADDGAETDGVDDAARAADEVDLASYPEEVRERFRALDPAQRKEYYEFYEYAGKHVEERIRRERERNDAVEAERKAEADRLASIRETHGKFIGLESQTLELPNGNTVELPSYDDLARLSQNQRGRDELRTKYGLDEDSAEFWRWMLDTRREMQDATRKHFDDEAWYRLDQNLQAGIRAAGLEPTEILKDARNPNDVIRQLVGKLRTDHATEVAKLKADHDAHRGVLNGNAEGLRARALAGSTRQPATGGRSGGNGTAVLTPDRYAAMSYEERQQLRSTPEGRARIDKMTGSR